MASRVRVVMNDAGVRDLLRSAEIEADLKSRADRIAAAAGEGMVASVRVGKTRVHAAVVTETAHAMNGEAKDRRLTRAIDAGRG